MRNGVSMQPSVDFVQSPKCEPYQQPIKSLLYFELLMRDLGIKTPGQVNLERCVRQ